MDERIEKGRQFKYTCIVDALYQLALYLIQCKEEDIENTLFFVGNYVPDYMYKKLPNYVCYKMNSYYDVVRFRFLAAFKWRYRYKTTIIALDHCWLSYALVGHHDYTYIEDAPYKFIGLSKFLKNPPREIIRDPMFVFPSLWKKIAGRIIMGPTFGKACGRNGQCVNRIITSSEDVYSDLLKNKRFTLLDTAELWDKSSANKKEYIKDLFGINKELIDTCKKAKVIVLTDPLMLALNYTENQVFELYRPYIEKYSSDGIIVKPHYRDEFNYSKYFPSVSILNTKVPMQLLTLIGVKYDVAIISIFSSAIYGMPETTKIIRIIE